MSESKPIFLPAGHRQRKVKQTYVRDYSRKIRGKWREHCPNHKCNEIIIADELEPLYDQKGIYVGAGIECGTCGTRLYVIDRRKCPIIVKCARDLRPLTFQDFDDYHSDRPLC